MVNFLHTYSPQPILLKLGPITIYWYGFLIVSGAILGLLVILKLIKYYNIKSDTIFDLSFWLAIFCLLGGRVYYILYAHEYFFAKNNFLNIFKIWQGGLAIHGVIIGGLLTLLVYSYKKRLSFWLLADIFAVLLSCAQIVGRWGNYFNQEIFGKPTDLPWGIPINVVNRPVNYLNFEYFHPTFLYESLLSILIFGILIFLHWRRIKKMQNSKLKIKNYGNVFLIYLILYSLVRFFMEFLRVDFSPLIFSIRWAQVFSIFIIVLSLAALFIRNKKQKVS